MGKITPEYIDEQIGYLRTEHEFIIVYDEEFGGSPLTRTRPVRHLRPMN